MTIALTATAIKTAEKLGLAKVTKTSTIVATAIQSAEVIGMAQFIQTNYPAPPAPAFPDWAQPPVVYGSALTFVGGVSVTGTTATVQTTVAHGLSVGQLVQMSGIDYAGANFLTTVTAIPDSTHFSYTWVV